MIIYLQCRLAAHCIASRHAVAVELGAQLTQHHGTVAATHLPRSLTLSPSVLYLFLAAAMSVLVDDSPAPFLLSGDLVVPFNGMCCDSDTRM